MSSKVIGLVFESSLERPEKFILLALADHAKEDGSDVYPSIARIEWKTGYSERQIRTLMRNLESLGVLQMVHPGGSGPADVRKYKIVLSAIPMLTDFNTWKESKGAKTAPMVRGQSSPQKGGNLQQFKGAKTAPESITNNQELLEPEPSASRSHHLKKTSAMACEKRHPRIQEMIMRAYADQAGIDCPWDGAEGKQLQAFLRRSPRVTDQQIAQCIANMYATVGFAKGTRPCQFLPYLEKYVHGPLNEFNRQAWVMGATYWPDPDVAIKVDYSYVRSASRVVPPPRSFNIGLGWWF